MQLLVSVRDPVEAEAALLGGAHIIDAKEPQAGALGAVSLDILRRIVAVVSGMRPVTAALGDASDPRVLARDAAAFCGAGAAMVKVGFAGIRDRSRVHALVRAAVDAAGHRERMIAVAYADYSAVGSLGPTDILDVAAHCGIRGILLDTADKDGPGLTSLMTSAAIGALTASARERGLQVAIAGRLTIEDLRYVMAAGADVVGVRGAACDGGRSGCVDVARVRALLDACAPARCHNDIFVKESECLSSGFSSRAAVS